MNIKTILYSITSLLVCASVVHAAELTEAERRAAVAEAEKTTYGDIIQQAKKIKKDVTQQPIPTAQQLPEGQVLDRPATSAPILNHKLLLKNENYEIVLDPVLLQTSKTLQDVIENAGVEAVIPIEANQQTIDLLVQALKDHTMLRGVPYNELIKVIKLYDFLHIQSAELSLGYLFEIINDKYNINDLFPDIQELFLRYYFREYIIKNTLKFNAEVTSVALSADGSIALASSSDDTAQIVDVKTGEILHTLQSVTSVALSADGSIIMTSLSDGATQIIDVKTGKPFHTIKFKKPVRLALSANGSVAMVGSWDNTAQIVNVKTGEILHILQLDGEVFSIALSADGSIAMVGLSNIADTKQQITTQIIDVKTGKLLHALQFNEPVRSVALSADGSIAMAGSWDGTTQIVNIKTNRFLHVFQFAEAVFSVALSADGSIAMVGPFDRIAQIIDVKTGKLLHTLQFNGAVTSIALSTDGSTAMAGSWDNTAQIIDVKTSSLHTLQFAKEVASVALSADGSIAIAGSLNGTAQIAQLTLSTQPIEVLIEQYKTKVKPLPSLITESSKGVM